MIFPYSFVGKRILVTGAGRGLGKALVHALVKNEGTVIALSRTKDNLDQLKQDLPSVTTLCVDLRNWKETREAVQSIGGGVDLLVNNAALNVKSTLLEATPEDFDSIFHANILSAINITQIVAKGMIHRNTGGSVVNISSVGTRIPAKKQGLYSGSKAAMDNMTQIWAAELGCHNIRMNTVNPGLFPSNMSKASLNNPNNPLLKATLQFSPLGRVGEIEEIVNVVLFLLSDYSSYITGENLYVSGGLR